MKHLWPSSVYTVISSYIGKRTEAVSNCSIFGMCLRSRLTLGKDVLNQNLQRCSVENITRATTTKVVTTSRVKIGNPLSKIQWFAFRCRSHWIQHHPQVFHDQIWIVASQIEQIIVINVVIMSISPNWPNFHPYVFVILRATVRQVDGSQARWRWVQHCFGGSGKEPVATPTPTFSDGRDSIMFLIICVDGTEELGVCGWRLFLVAIEPIYLNSAQQPPTSLSLKGRLPWFWIANYIKLVRVKGR